MSEENGLRTIKLVIEGMHCDRCVQNVMSALSDMDGVDFFNVVVGKADIRYLPQLVSRSDIEQAIESSGYSVQKNEQRKGFFGRFIDKMIDSNKKNFGNERLDCCNLSSGGTKHTITKKE